MFIKASLLVFLFFLCSFSEISKAEVFEPYKVEFSPRLAYVRAGDKSQHTAHYGSLRRITNNSLSRHRYYSYLGVYHNLIEAEDKSSNSLVRWVSKENFNLNLGYQYKMSKKIWIGFKGSYHVRHFEAELNPNFTSDDGLSQVYRLALAIDYEALRWSFGLDADYSGEQFIYERDNNISLEKIFLHGLSLRLKYKWFATPNWSSRLTLKVELPFNNSNTIEAEGQGGVIGYFDLGLNQWTQNNSLNCQAYYGIRNYTNDQNNQKEKMAGLNCGVLSFNWL